MTQTALITGASRGIGRAIALLFAQHHIHCVLVARNSSNLRKVQQEIEAQGGRATIYECDLTSSESIKTLTQKIEQEVGLISILVNNAGVATSAKLDETDDTLWRDTLALNLDAPFYLSRAFVPHMKKLSGGSIVNVASTAALEGYAYTSAYTASKHGLLGLTRALAVELKKSNIQVNAICPGFVRTDIVRESALNISKRTGRSIEESESELAKLNKDGRLMEPEEVAAVALQLVSSGNTITGKAVDITGIPID